jgi:hypothetical protein
VGRLDDCQAKGERGRSQKQRLHAFVFQLGLMGVSARSSAENFLRLANLTECPVGFGANPPVWIA